MKKTTSKVLLALSLGVAAIAVPAQLIAADKPNILVIWGDDIGQSNISAYTRGLMGYKTPNIDRLADEGLMFTDYYAEQSCTAGRSTFILGQSVLRTGLSKVGMPGAKEELIVFIVQYLWFVKRCVIPDDNIVSVGIVLL